MTAEILEYDDERGAVVVNVISSNRSCPDADQRKRTILVTSVTAAEPTPRAEQPWPYSDPCREAGFSIGRSALRTTLFLSLIVGSGLLFFLTLERPYGLQEASAVAYTLFVVFFTFAATGGGKGGGKGSRPYLFTCPAVRPHLPRLLWRHVGFLAALFALQTAALAVRPNLPDWWNLEDRRGGTPFELAMLFLWVGLVCPGLLQPVSSRRRPSGAPPVSRRSQAALSRSVLQILRPGVLSRLADCARERVHIPARGPPPLGLSRAGQTPARASSLARQALRKRRATRLVAPHLLLAFVELPLARRQSLVLETLSSASGVLIRNSATRRSD